MARALSVYFLWVKVQFEMELELAVFVKMSSPLGVLLG
ncbi:hypothetical protein D934_03960 [Xylella fastidiosa subsp. sandyi Ann-1]|uniref:Uncharacterized protein n=1 Tax=Xylella fastidiosa subsp. sandyi Ann-1 TaxID=155920 RepID=A0A060H6Y6_XYLFS|nr:hypothetical protein D934_03960 [Xylella fastidiosa subsp. sandyi Ann-1]